MTKNNFKAKLISKILIVLAFILSATSLCCGVFGTNAVYAYTEKNTSLSNLNFSANANLTNVYTNPTGWEKGLESTGTSGAINLDHRNDTFYLDANQVPSKLNDTADDYVLMINSKSASSELPCAQYYTNTSSLSLKAYSNYKIVVWARVLEKANASIYITGLDETLGFEEINFSVANEWTAFTFYISTGIDTESIKTELWLGAKPDKTSTSAVFFDNIEIFQISNDQTPNTVTDKDKYVSLASETTSYEKYIDLNKSQNFQEFDGTFETDLTGWTNATTFENGTYAEIINQSNNNTSIAKDIEYLGTDLAKGNTKSLVLYTDENVTSAFGIKSPSITIPMYQTYKISINAKVGTISGSAYIKFIENEIKNASGDVVDAITPVEKEIAISANASNAFANNYNTYSFYVKGRSLYATSFNLELWLGSSDNKASGIVSFDNITIEEISNSQYSAVTTNNSTLSFALQSDSDEYGITNATFNDVYKNETSLTYPLIPSSWAHKSSDNYDIVYGVVNTYNPVYNEYSAKYENIANPGNPEGFLSTNVDTNNILVMHNINNAYQSVTSNKFSVSSTKYYKLSFDYKLIATDSNNDLLNIYVIDENNNVLYADENITPTNFTWKKYTIHISTNVYSNELKLIVSLGTENSLVKGIAYLDNITLFEDTSMTKEKYELVSETKNVLDFQEGNFNLIKDNGTNIYSPLRYTGSLEVGTNPSTGSPIALGGIVDGNDTEDEFDIENSPKNQNSLKYMMMIQTHGKATYSMIARDSLSFSTDSYYKFTIDIKTLFSSNAENDTESYGAEFGISGLDQNIKNIVANEWTTYTIFVKTTADTTAYLRFALSSANTNTAGMVFFDNYTYEVVDADAYNLAELNNSNDSTFLFVGDTDEKEEDKDDSSSSLDLNAIWYVIPSLILAVALILALVSYLMKKVKIKKWEKKKVNEYDREKTVHRDIIRKTAEERRDARVKELKSQIEGVQSHIAEIEEKHQERLKDRRSSRQKGISKEAEKEFKQYAKLHTALENKVIALNREIDNMNTPEYLLSIQHKIAVEKAKAEREAKEKAFSKSKKKSK